MTTTESKHAKELTLLDDFCEENYFTTKTQWLIWWNGVPWGHEMAASVLFEFDGDIYIDEKAWQNWMIDTLWMEDKYTRKSAKEFVKATYVPGAQNDFVPTYLKGKRKKNKYGL